MKVYEKPEVEILELQCEEAIMTGDVGGSNEFGNDEDW